MKRNFQKGFNKRTEEDGPRISLQMNSRSHPGTSFDFSEKSLRVLLLLLIWNSEVS